MQTNISAYRELFALKFNKPALVLGANSNLTSPALKQKQGRNRHSHRGEQQQHWF